MEFSGTKLALFIGPKVLVILRDDFPNIPYPGHWDFPGGARDGDETPEACVMRETWEEVGLQLPASRLIRVAEYLRPVGSCWFFAAHLDPAVSAQVQLGDEGQDLKQMSVQEYASHNLRIPHFADWLNAYASTL